MYQQALKVEKANKEVYAENKGRMHGKRKIGVGNSQDGHFNKKPFPFKNNAKGSQSKPYCRKSERHHHDTYDVPVEACFRCSEMGT